MKFNICKKLIAFLVLSLMVAPFSAFASEEVRGSGRNRWSIDTLNDYFTYADSLGLPRTLIIGAGRAENYAEENYENAMAYFLVDANEMFKPDYFCNIRNMDGLSRLGLDEWDIIVLEGLPIGIYLDGTGINNVYKLLKNNGCITFVLNSNWIQDYYDYWVPRASRLGDLASVLERCKAAQVALQLLENSCRRNLYLSKVAKDSIIKKAFNFDVENQPSNISLDMAVYFFGTYYYPKRAGVQDFETDYIVCIRKLPEE